jgi:hypothetical protein
MTVPRLAYLAGLALLLLAGAFLLTDHLLAPPPGVTEENARRIRPGMSRAWTERVLGPPADAVYCGGALQFAYWRGPACRVWVRFEDGDRAARVKSFPAR